MYVITNPNIQFVFHVYVSSKNKLQRSIFNTIFIFNSKALNTKKCRLSHKNLVPNVFFFYIKSTCLLKTVVYLAFMKGRIRVFFILGQLENDLFN